MKKIKETNPLMLLIAQKRLPIEEVRQMMTTPWFTGAAVVAYPNEFSVEEKLQYITEASGHGLPLPEDSHYATLQIVKVFIDTAPNAKELLEKELSLIQSRSDLKNDFVLNPIRYQIAAYCMLKNVSLEEKIALVERMERIVGWDFSYNPSDKSKIGLETPNIFLETIDVTTIPYGNIFSYIAAGIRLGTLMLRERLEKENPRHRKIFSDLLAYHSDNDTLIQFCINKTKLYKKQKITLLKGKPQYKNLLLSIYSETEKLEYGKKTGDYDVLRGCTKNMTDYKDVKKLYKYSNVENHDFFTPYYDSIKKGFEDSEFSWLRPTEKQLLQIYKEHPTMQLARLILSYVQLSKKQLETFTPLLLKDEATYGFLKQEQFNFSLLKNSQIENVLIHTNDAELVKKFFAGEYSTKYFSEEKFISIIEQRITLAKNNSSNTTYYTTFDVIVSLTPISFEKKYQYAKITNQYGSGYTWKSLVS